MNKRRLSASVDADLVQAAERAVAAGLADSVSAWINAAMRRQLEHERRLRALHELIATYEAAHGEITLGEIEAATRKARTNALVVRPRGGRKASKHRKPRGPRVAAGNRP